MCSIKDLTKSGRKKDAEDPKLDTKIVTLIDKNASMSVRDLAKKVQKSVWMIQRVKRRHNLKTY